MKKTLWWGLGVVLVLALAFGGWWIWGREQGPIPVKAITVAPLTIQEEVYAAGTVVPVSRQEIRVLNPSLVTKVAVKAGDSVEAGQILITLDTTLANAQAAQAKANVEAAQTNVKAAQSSLNELKNNQSGTFEDNPLSTQDNPLSTQAIPQAEGVLAQSKAALKQAQEALRIAQLQLQQMTYKATMAGTVLEVNAQEGNLSPVQQPLVTVADLSQLNVESQMNEVDAGKIRPGGKVTISSRLLGNLTAQGTITEISPQATVTPSVQGNSAPTVGVKIHLDHAPAGLKPGFSVNVLVITAYPWAAVLSALFWGSAVRSWWRIY